MPATRRRRLRARKTPRDARFLFVLACALLASGTAMPAQAEELSEQLGARRVCEQGPAARAARAERLAGAAQVTAAGVLPNPSLFVEHQRALNGTTQYETVLGVSVPLSVGGRRGLLRDAARVRAHEADFAARDTLLGSALEFRRAYAAAVIDRARVAALAEQQAQLEALSELIAGLQKGGEAAEYDRLRQRVHARLHARSVELAAARARGSLAFVEAWLGQAVSLPPAPLLELAGGAAGDARAFDAPSAEHPTLLRLQADARASAIEARAADRRWIPDLELFAGYRGSTVSSFSGHGLSLALTVPLTFFDYGQGEAALARAHRELALAEQGQLHARYDAQLHAADAQLQALHASLADGESLSVEASALVAATQQLYMAGEATLTELLDALRSAEEARLGVIDLAHELVLARLSRMQAAGTQLDAALDQACGGKDGSR